MVNAVGRMPATVAYVHVRFSVKVSIGLIFTFFHNILAQKIITYATVVGIPTAFTISG
jgi:hypothetical protein